MNKRWYVHKHEVSQAYGGSEEGGWWFDTGEPVKATEWTPISFDDEEKAYAYARMCNDNEHERAKKEEDYEYHSVLSYKSTHYSYGVFDEPVAKAYPEVTPHYE